MSRDLRAALRALVLPTLAVLLAIGVVPGRLPLVLRLYSLFVCCVALALGLVALRRAFPPARPVRRAPTRRSERRTPPPALARIEDEVALGVAGAFDLHHRLVPRLRTIAAGLLQARRRVSLDADPAHAELILGNEAWSLVRADRSPPEDRLARGLPPDALSRVLDSLEAV
jgi:hypothetical protein